MLNKKLLSLVIVFSFLFSIFSFILVQVHAQETPPLPSDVGKIQDLSEKTTKTIEELREQEKREYLFNEWKNLLLKNQFVSILDSFFTKISPVFLGLFGEPYTLSGFLFLIVILWFCFFFKFSEIFSDYSVLSPWVCWLIGFGMAVMLAQTQVLRKIAEFFVWLAFYKEATWWRVLIVLAILVGLILAYKFSSEFGKKFKENKQKTEDEINRMKLKTGAKIAEGFTKGLE